VQLATAELERCLDTLTNARDVARYPEGDVLDLGGFAAGAGRLGLVRRYPVGPVAAISPFNFPLNLVAHKLGPAIAAGCPVVLKPASQTPSPALLLAEILTAAGLPAGALAVVPCASRDAAALVEDDRLKALTFTGSAEVGWALKARAGRKKVLLELGGNAAAIVEPDADLAWAARRCAVGAYAFAGQSCISVQRVLVHRAVADRFREALLAAVRDAVVTGDPGDPATVCGPLVTPEDADRVLAWTRAAETAGARRLCGGERHGSVVQPVVLDGLRAGTKVRDEEVFGPVLSLAEYDDFEEALARTNDGRFGLQAGLFTSDVQKVWRALDALEVGGLVHDDAPTFRVDRMPYGGVKDSGAGREGPRYAYEELTEPRLLVLTRRG
jgi:acyl-CoA reductase-like NAD-dependent aldehyde dehydrogenase